MHEAADGGLARIRLPGGVLSATALAGLAAAAAELGDGTLELTSRANVQIRGLAAGDPVELGRRLADVGLLPSESHERVRNILASPLSGLDAAGHTDVVPIAAALDAELIETPRLGGLPGRFLFGLDDGRGDIFALEPDVCVVATGRGRGVLYPGGFALDLDRAVPAMLAVADAFLAELAAGAAVWRIAELPDGGQGIVERLELDEQLALGERLAYRPPAAPSAPVGVIGSGPVVVLAPLGRLTGAQTRAIQATTGRRGIRVTPWHSIVIIDAQPARIPLLAAAGLGLTVESPWYRVSACTGQPGCAKAIADVRADATAELDRYPGRRVRWSGCARRCGRPVDTEVDVVATAAGYQTTGSPV